MKKHILIYFIFFVTFPLMAKDTIYLKIGAYENPPKIYTDTEGNISGFWADISNYIAEKEKWEIEWVQGNWDQCLERLESGEIDIMVDVGVTPDRQKMFIFSMETVLLSWTRLYTQQGVSLESLMDLEGKQIAALKGSFNLEGPEGLKDIITRFNLNSKIIEMDNYYQVFEALEKKEVFAGITNKDFGAHHEMDFDIVRTPIIFQPARMQFAFNKNFGNSSTLIKIIDSNILELKKDSKSLYYTSMEKYLGGIEELEVFPLWVIIFIIIILGLTLIFFILYRVFKYQVRRKTLLLQQDIIRREKVEKDLVSSNLRFKTLFDNSPVPVWEEDFSELYVYFNEVKEKGMTDIRDFLDKNMEELSICANKIKIIDINQACINLFLAETREELLGALNITFTEKSYSIFKEEIIALANGKLEFQSESEILDLEGKLRYIDLRMIVINEGNNTVKALVSTTDITDKRKIEVELDNHRQNLLKMVEEKTINLKESQQSLVYLLEDINETKVELEEKNKELEKFNVLFVDREFRIKELRDRVKELEGEK